MKSGKKMRSDVLLWANGRTGNTQDMGLEGLGVRLDARGQIKVDESYQTDLPHIYAVGDVIGPPSLASAAYDQGRFAATHIVHGSCDTRLARDIPTGIYTTPEISSLGRTERELTEARARPLRGGPHATPLPRSRRSRGRPWGCSSCSFTARRTRSWASTASATRPARSSTSARS